MSTSTERIPRSLGTDEKEVYAFYGLAAFSAQVLEKALVSILALLETEGRRTTRAEFEAIFSSFDSRTFGHLLRRLNQGLPLPPETGALLTQALLKRNFLAHQFFASRAAAFQVEAGRAQMIEELRGLAALFQEAEDLVAIPWEELLVKHGLTHEELDRRAEAIVKAFVEDDGGRK